MPCILQGQTLITGVDNTSRMKLPRKSLQQQVPASQFQRRKLGTRRSGFQTSFCRPHCPAKKNQEGEARTSSHVGLRSSTASAVQTVSLTPPPPTPQPNRKVNKRPRPPSRPSTRSKSRAHPQQNHTPPDQIDAVPSPPTRPEPKESHWTQKKKSLES